MKFKAAFGKFLKARNQCDISFPIPLFHHQEAGGTTVLGAGSKHVIIQNTKQNMLH